MGLGGDSQGTDANQPGSDSDPRPDTPVDSDGDETQGGTTPAEPSGTSEQSDEQESTNGPSDGLQYLEGLVAIEQAQSSEAAVQAESRQSLVKLLYGP